MSHEDQDTDTIPTVVQLADISEGHYIVEVGGIIEQRTFCHHDARAWVNKGMVVWKLSRIPGMPAMKF